MVRPREAYTPLEELWCVFNSAGKEGESELSKNHVTASTFSVNGKKEFGAFLMLHPNVPEILC